MHKFCTLFFLLLLAACADSPPAATEDVLPPLPEPISAITWDEVAEAPRGRFEAQSVVVDGKFYVLGGYTDEDIIPISFSFDVYDPVADSWSQLPELPRPITHAGSAADEENIYLAGGVVGAASAQVSAKIDATDEVWRYHIPSASWALLPSLPEPRGAGALAVLEGKLHFFGGTTTDRYTEVGDHWILDLQEGSEWQVSAPLPNPRNHLSSIVLNGKIYAIGGQHGHNETLITQTSVQSWTPTEPDRWTELASLPYGLGHTSNATVSYQGRIYIIGGETERFKFTDAVLVYDPVADAWDATSVFLTQEHSLLAGVIGNRVYVTGGSDLSLRTVQGSFSN